MITLRAHRYAILLAALLCVSIVKSFGQHLLHPVLTDLVMMTTMLLVFLIVFVRRVDRRVAFVALVVAVATFVAPYVRSGTASQPTRVIHHSASLLLSGFATFVILRSIFAQRVIRADDVLGAVCGYLLAAQAWSDLYLLIESCLPGSFSVGAGFNSGLATWDGRIVVMSNLSLGALTSLGSTAAMAVRPPATIMVPLEAMFGQFYIAVVVAQLVGARLSQEPQ